MNSLKVFATAMLLHGMASAATAGDLYWQTKAKPTWNPTPQLKASLEDDPDLPDDIREARRRRATRIKKRVEARLERVESDKAEREKKEELAKKNLYLVK